jgi:hypothetical protein
MVPCFRALLHYFPAGTEEDHEKFQSGFGINVELSGRDPV